MSKPLINFISLLTTSLILAFSIHLFILHQLDYPLFANKIHLAYGLNYLLALLTFWVLYRYRTTLKNQLGFIFIGFSFFKFFLFFIVFYTSYKADGQMDRLEFATFFIPYSLCLAIEVLSLSKLLNKLS
ncbi:DUF6168 family protein [Flavobacteriaceae bacterium F08102]|nr:DUF6168 family protein [Flavobacteriaceae bacterium F08102]